MSRPSTQQLHMAWLSALEPNVEEHTALSSKPLNIELSPPLPARVRLYLYNATDPPGGRPTGEYKIQIIIPGQQPGERADFDRSNGRFVVLAGYVESLGVFVLWDAGLYSNIAYSRNCQVRSETIHRSLLESLAYQERTLHHVGLEKVIAVHESNLPGALERRFRLTEERYLK